MPWCSALGNSLFSFCLLQTAIETEACTTAVIKQETGCTSTPSVKAELNSSSGADSGSGTSMLRVAAYSGPFPGWGVPSTAACRQVVQRLAALHGMPSVQRRASGGRPQVGCEEKRSVLDSLVRWGPSQGAGRRWHFSVYKGRAHRLGGMLPMAPVCHVSTLASMPGQAASQAGAPLAPRAAGRC